MGARQKCSRHTGKLKRRGGLWFTMGFHQHNAGSWSAAAEETMREWQSASAASPFCMGIRQEQTPPKQHGAWRGP